MEVPIDREDVVVTMGSLHRAQWKLDRILMLLEDDDEEEADEADA